jgi:hypothetical protein
VRPHISIACLPYSMRAAAHASADVCGAAINNQLAGKGTLAVALAARLNLAYLDTGLLYRAVGYAVSASTLSIRGCSRSSHGPVDAVMLLMLG